MDSESDDEKSSKEIPPPSKKLPSTGLPPRPSTGLPPPPSKKLPLTVPPPPPDVNNIMVLEMHVKNMTDCINSFKEFCELDQRNPTKDELDYIDSINADIKKYNNIIIELQKALNKKGGRTRRQKRRKTKRNQL
jgi:hypothetical protein